MNGNTDLRTIQQNIITYIQKNWKDKIDALKWEAHEDETHRLFLYRGGEKSILVFAKQEPQSYNLSGWELRLEKKLRSVVTDER